MFGKTGAPLLHDRVGCPRPDIEGHIPGTPMVTWLGVADVLTAQICTSSDEVLFAVSVLMGLLIRKSIGAVQPLALATCSVVPFAASVPATIVVLVFCQPRSKALVA